ncbi:Oxidase ustYa [Lasiodiplodia hormozganensis]|uniref:Oxidase ustYa n=1 Tax=Lasiodiplodia hormozganensis TaxID=869390 RepID=A0AA39U147_9PEZI|nr:Oxidase ustYa [Lasiodiplodia hormozganensis]
MLDGAVSAKREYQKVALDEEAAQSSQDEPRVARPTSWHYICIFVLALGWAATAAHDYRTQAIEHEENESILLHVYSHTPIPREVFNPVKKVFDKDPRYMGDGPEVNHYWDKLVAGHDAVWIENPQQWSLPEGIVAPYDHPNTPSPKPTDFYVISILHQLHCLNMIRFQYYQEKKRVDTSADPDAFKWKVHVEHCFEYLRQGISCGGDLVIEGSSPINVGKGHATSVTGWGVEHDCIDFDRLRQFQIEQEAKYNETWQQHK